MYFMGKLSLLVMLHNRREQMPGELLRSQWSPYGWWEKKHEYCLLIILVSVGTGDITCDADIYFYSCSYIFICLYLVIYCRHGFLTHNSICIFIYWRWEFNASACKGVALHNFLWAKYWQVSRELRFEMPMNTPFKYESECLVEYTKEHMPADTCRNLGL